MKRDRSVHEIISLLAQFVDRGESQVDYPPRLQDELRQLLNMIENADRKEVEKVKKEMNSEELEHQCEEIYRDAERAKEALDSGEEEIVNEYLERILELEKNVYKRIETEDLGEKFQKSDFIGDGRNARVFELKNHNDLVLKIMDESNFSDPKSMVETFKRYQKIEEQLPEEVQVARIRRVGYYDGHAALIIDKAPGREVHWEPDSVKGEVTEEQWYSNWSKMNSLMAEAPQEHYKKLSRDVNTLRKHNIKVDPKSDNIFFHPEEGFTLIDLAKDDLTRGDDKKRYQPDILGSIAGPWLANKFQEKLSKSDIRNMQKIEEKIEEAGNPGSKEDVVQKTKNRIRQLESEILDQ